MSNQSTIHVFSDATGELAHSLAVAAVNQFPSHRVEIVRVRNITSFDVLTEAVKRARKERALVIFTFVSSEMRQTMLDLAMKNEVAAIDVMGPTLNAMETYFHMAPSDQPGLQYKMTKEYFKRTEAVEFSVKHDDGLGLDTVKEADIVLLGISRTSKTPLSVYLSYSGYRCANMPIVKDIAVPEQILNLERKKLFGLTIDVDKLSNIRSSRLKKMGQSKSDSYATESHIRDEIKYAINLFRQLQIPIIDVTGKAIEETASEVVSLLKSR